MRASPTKETPGFFQPSRSSDSVLDWQHVRRLPSMVNMSLGWNLTGWQISVHCRLDAGGVAVAQELQACAKGARLHFLAAWTED